MKRFRGLTEAQSAAFGIIATGGHPFAHPRTLAALERGGLIEGHAATIAPPPGKPAWLAIKVRQYTVPVAVHMEWCAWCADNAETEL